MNQHVRPRAFTLIEMLVVVAVIAILMAVMMPALSKARQQAKAAQCIANMKQIIMGAHLYATENNSIIPVWLDDDFLLTGTSDPAPWIVKIMPYVQNRGELWVCPDSFERSGMNLARLHNAMDKKAVDDVTGDFYLQSWKSMNININCYGFPRTDVNAVGGRKVPKWLARANPSELIYAGDGTGYNSAYYNPRNGMTWIPMIQSIYPAHQNSVYPRHANRSANMVFLDGHASNVQEQTLRTWSVANTPIWYRHWWGADNR